MDDEIFAFRSKVQNVNLVILAFWQFIFLKCNYLLHFPQSFISLI